MIIFEKYVLPIICFRLNFAPPITVVPIACRISELNLAKDFQQKITPLFISLRKIVIIEIAQFIDIYYLFRYHKHTQRSDVANYEQQTCWKEIFNPTYSETNGSDEKSVSKDVSISVIFICPVTVLVKYDLK